ncbi:hypothetical protein M407DRAFT_219976 [Tulasnella calospora MUT 4182]|uniref:Uncharacterized protein n=1 Tax=Tulasnella calospora MUT 4182 TaxID=1051891 RepID=A0A0C3Q9P7_9AGAM|nr:hypothetical protein M407DRAFT_219976 [Tulasnella calospora MUT 4182]
MPSIPTLGQAAHPSTFFPPPPPPRVPSKTKRKVTSSSNPPLLLIRDNYQFLNYSLDQQQQFYEPRSGRVSEVVKKECSLPPPTTRNHRTFQIPAQNGHHHHNLVVLPPPATLAPRIGHQSGVQPSSAVTRAESVRKRPTTKRRREHHETRHTCGYRFGVERRRGRGRRGRAPEVEGERKIVYRLSPPMELPPKLPPPGRSNWGDSYQTLHPILEGRSRRAMAAKGKRR